MDSRFSYRELAAVKEWLDSDMAIHSMRDHPGHHHPLLGAGWGAHLDRKNARQLFKESWKKMLNDSLCYMNRVEGYGADQDILRK